MKDEIKEILDNIKNKYEDYYVQDIVSGNDLKLLLDYITNLQEENEKLKYYLTMSDEEIHLYVNTIEEEIVKLRQRILKAIEYIKSNLIYDVEELLDILKGVDTDE